MDAITTFFDMGGYAAWVWPGYGLAAIVMVGLVLWTRHTLKSREAEFAHLRRHRRGPDDMP